MKQQRYKIPIRQEVHEILIRWAEADNRTVSNLAETILKKAATKWEAKNPKQS